MKACESRSPINKALVVAVAVGLAAIGNYGFGADRLVLGEYLNATW